VKSTLPRIIACAMASSVSVLNQFTKFMKTGNFYLNYSSCAHDIYIST
jgi:hypothetical protein